jgi:hypothetical protein
MKSHEFIQAAADILAAAGRSKEPQVDITVSGRLHPVEPELDDKSDTLTMVAPLQQKLELLKKAVDVDSYFDANNPGYDPGPNEGDKSQEELIQIKRLAGVMHNAGDDNDVLDA